jgi:hypothetical protein
LSMVAISRSVFTISRFGTVMMLPLLCRGYQGARYVIP